MDGDAVPGTVASTVRALTKPMVGALTRIPISDRMAGLSNIRNVALKAFQTLDR